MKWITIFICFICVAIAAPAQAESWHTTNQSTIVWDAQVAPNPGDVVTYGLYVRNTITGVESFLGSVPATAYTFTFLDEGFFHVGVTTIRSVDLDLNGTYDPAVDVDEDGNPVILESEVNWSDVNGESTPNPFGFRYFVPLPPPGGIAVQ